MPENNHIAQVLQAVVRNDGGAAVELLKPRKGGLGLELGDSLIVPTNVRNFWRKRASFGA